MIIDTTITVLMALALDLLISLVIKVTIGIISRVIMAATMIIMFAAVGFVKVIILPVNALNSPLLPLVLTF